jgi:serine/threonine-protein kinase
LHEAHELTDASGHPLGLVHRDVSPGNILLGLDGSVKLADFGIAKETRVQTLSGSMHGTVTYMAPEQCRGHAFDLRADVFSLGVILYELVTGTRLFWADNDVASLHRVLSGTVPRPRKLRPTISTTLEEIVMAAVAHDQDKRLATARELADALEIYAAEAGEILGARWTARWVHEILGPREVPWIAAAAPVVAEDDGSLVELIAPLEDEPVDPTFGPSFSDEIDTEPQRARPTKSNKKLAVFIAAGLVAGAGATAFVMTRGDAPTPATVVEPPAKIEMAVEPPTVAPIEKVKAEASPEAPEAINITPTPTRTRVVKRKKPPVKESTTTAPPAKPPPAKPPPAKAIDENAPAVVVEPKPAGSGSARSTTKAEWNPTMLLPTDSGSGTKKQ